MIFGIGIDVLEIDRFAEVFERLGPAFFEKICTDAEIAYCNTHANPLPHFAARFAAKEALSKALGVGIGSKLSWKDMEISHDSHGRPKVIWHIDIEQIFGVTHSHLSISHSKNTAIAFAILETTKK